MNFSFLLPRNITVGRGAHKNVGALVRKYAKKVAIFRYGERFFTSGIYDSIKKSLDEHGVDSCVYEHVKGEPSPEVINAAARYMVEEKVDGALAIGGGSVIDAAKAACALAPNGSDIMAYVEGFSPQKFTRRPLPLIALPTTGGTGSECTKNSVITLKGSFKNSVRDDDMLPVAAVLDAELALDVPKEATANAGADCMCHLVECYVTRFANPLSDAISLGFMKRVNDALPTACAYGQDIDAREDMLLSACAAGLAMSNSGLGAGHGIAAGMGAMTPLTHGFICGVVLPGVMRFNIEKGVLKYADIARAITGNSYVDDLAASLDAVRIVEGLNDAIGIPRGLDGTGVTKEDVPAIAKASMGSSMGKNPVDVTLEECEDILYKLF